MDRAMFAVCNAYKMGAVHVQGHLCKTNIASHTAFRGFGSPQVCTRLRDRIGF